MLCFAFAFAFDLVAGFDDVDVDFFGFGPIFSNVEERINKGPSIDDDRC